MLFRSGNLAEEAKLVNATANTQDAVKVSMGKGFRFGAKARAAELVA